MTYLQAFRMPSVMDIKGRTSSITNAFVLGVIPFIKPTEQEIKQILDILGMTPENIFCAYCGKHYALWDHFRPVVRDKKPTGYISEIWNLIPCCNECNSSKGNKDWRAWINGTALKSPRMKNTMGLENRIEKLNIYEQHTNDRVSWLDFSKIVDSIKWQEYWDNHEELLAEMRQSQLLSNDIKNDIALYIKRSK
ncbi:MAG: HNH endonuclease [Firmicutes bacterium]|nr:HNH endonuclease [Bacillota bacterium]